MKRVVSAVACLLALATSAQAAELKPAHVAADAKWVMHLDWEALSASTLAQRFREERPEKVKGMRQWLKQRYGIDPQEDLQSITLYGTTYKPHTGVIVMQAAYDRQKVESLLKEEASGQATTWQGLELYTVDKEKHHKKASYGEKGSHNDGHDNEKMKKESKDDAKHAMSAGKGKKTVTILLYDDNTVVMASSQEAAKSAVKVLKGDAKSLQGVGSKLVGELPEGTIAYAAAVDLNKIGEHGRSFPLLEQLKRVTWVVGEEHEEDDGEIELFKDVTVVAKNEEVATQVQKIMEGMIAAGKVIFADAKTVTELYDEVEFELDGATLNVEWDGDVEEVWTALQEIKPRLEKWHKGHHSVEKR